MDLILSILLIVFVFFAGGAIEKRHYKSLQLREKYNNIPIATFDSRKFTFDRKIKKIELVSGETVVSGDYFKQVVAFLKSIFGGELNTYQTLLERARREAILRLKENAKNASLILNVKIESVVLNPFDSEKNYIPKCAVIAYGTAITLENKK